jgi:hypothetical protein
MAEPRFSKSNPAVKPSHKGRLHRALGVPEGKTIPLSKLHRAMHSSSPHLKEMADYAGVMAGWKKK